MRASGFNDGAAYAEIQLARILVERGRFAEADELMAGVAAEFAGIGQSLSSLEAVMVQAVAKASAGQAEAALELLEDAAGAAGEDARLFEPQIAEVRARVLLALGRIEEAQRAIHKGLEAARDYALPYEEAMLLQARIDIAGSVGAEPDPGDVDACRKLMDGLGIE